MLCAFGQELVFNPRLHYVQNFESEKQSIAVWGKNQSPCQKKKKVRSSGLPQNIAHNLKQCKTHKKTSCFKWLSLVGIQI